MIIISMYFAHQKKFEYSLAAVIILFLAVFPVCVWADTTIITNSVKASANSGGNTVSGGGEISIGKTSMDIFVETIVNGETVEYIDEHYEDSDIPEGGIHKETHYESEDKSVVANTEITVNAEAENKTVPEVMEKKGILNQVSGETANVVNSVAKGEEQSEEKDDLINTGEETQVNNIVIEETKETKNTGLISFISNSVANLFKYVLSIFS